MELVREIEELSSDFGTSLNPQGLMGEIVTRLVNRYGLAAAGIWKSEPRPISPFTRGIRRRSCLPCAFA